MFNDEEGEFDELDEREFYDSEIDWDLDGDEEYIEPYSVEWCNQNCGFGCPEWGGDGLCMIDIRAQMEMKYDLPDRIWTFFYRIGNWFTYRWRKAFPEKLNREIDMDDLPF